MTQVEQSDIKAEGNRRARKLAAMVNADADDLTAPGIENQTELRAVLLEVCDTLVTWDRRS